MRLPDLKTDREPLNYLDLCGKAAPHTSKV